MSQFEREKGTYRISADPVASFRRCTRISHSLLLGRGNYKRRPGEGNYILTLFLALDTSRQIGFARVVTDQATFAYLCDIYVLEEYRIRPCQTRKCCVRVPAFDK